MTVPDPVSSDQSASLERCLRIDGGFPQSERERILKVLHPSLDARLATFRAEDVDMELSVKDRERPGQKVTLECWIARRDRLVATSSEPDLDDALMDVRADLRRQINDAKTRTEPNHRSPVRKTLPAPEP